MKKRIAPLLIVFLAGLSVAEIIYSNSFDDVSGTEGRDVVVEKNEIAGYFQAGSRVQTDGAGHLQSSDCSDIGANYRFRLNPDPLNINPTVSAVKLRAELRAPSSGWIGLAFQGENANSVAAAANTGPWVQVGDTDIVLHGGFYMEGSRENFSATHSPGDLLTLELTYHPAKKTADLILNGKTIACGLPLTHLDFETGEEADPSIHWVQVNLRQQPEAAVGGAYLDSLTVETFSAPPSERNAATLRVLGSENGFIRMFSLNAKGLRGRSMYVFSGTHDKALKTFPAVLNKSLYYELSAETPHSFECLESGELLALAPVNGMQDHTESLEKIGFRRDLDSRPFQLFGDNPADVFGLFRREINMGESFEAPARTILAGFRPERKPRYGERLYNGIRLPKEWPPQYDEDFWLSDEPLSVPYLDHPPELIPIDVGRQLFVDDFLIEETDLTREYHYPQKYEGNPILKPETEIERKGYNDLAVAGPKSGGLWWNPEKQLFEFWYEAGWVSTVAYATSRDGLAWKRPDLPLKPGSNQVLPDAVKPDSWTVVRDYRAVDPKENFKIFLRGSGARERARAFTSEDGIDWGTHADSGFCGDRSTMFYNPFRGVWVYSLRTVTSGFGGRCRDYWEGDDFMNGMQWLPDEPVRWARTDKLDPPNPDIGNTPQLYNLDAVAYESIMLGCFEILHGPDNDVNAAKGIPKNTGLNFAYSRDGFHWHRPDRTLAIQYERRDVWDRGYVQPLGNICTVRGDKLWFYYIGFAGDPAKTLGSESVGESSMRSGLYGNGATGVAFLRRDGFVSLNAEEEECLLTSRPVTFTGRHLFVNADAPEGELVAEVLDMTGRPVAPFTFDNCRPFRGDSTIAQIHWKGGDNLTALAGRAVRVRFRLKSGKLYSFWVSRDQTGRSDGYVAGGGPGFTCDTDTVGVTALEENSRFLP